MIVEFRIRYEETDKSLALPCVWAARVQSRNYTASPWLFLEPVIPFCRVINGASIQQMSPSSLLLQFIFASLGTGFTAGPSPRPRHSPVAILIYITCHTFLLLSESVIRLVTTITRVKWYVEGSEGKNKMALAVMTSADGLLRFHTRSSAKLGAVAACYFTLLF